MKHQIITVGRDFDTIYLGIKEFAPDVIHLLVTKESESLSLPLQEMLCDKIEIKVYRIGPYDVENIIALCESIVKEYPNDEFSYNLSEGTKIMAMSAFKVSQQHNHKAYYITQDSYYIDTHDYVRRPLTQSISNEEYLKLYGGSVRAYEDVSKVKSLDIHTAYYCKKFIELYYDIYRLAKSWYRSINIPKADTYYFKGTLANGCTIETDSGTLSIYRGFNVFFDSACKRSCELMFLGRWWEVVVADTVSEWKKRRSEDGQADGIWRDVIFNENTTTAVKNEVDLLVNDKHRLLLIECKSGEVLSSDIFKIDSVCRTYAGDNSKAILVSYLPLTASVIEKCKDLGIYYFAPKSMEAKKQNIKSLPDWLDTIVKKHEL